MPIAKQASSANRISQDVVSQISSITSYQNSSAELAPARKSAAVSSESSSSSSSKDEKIYSDNINLRLPKGERKRLKAFCAAHDISMTQFIVFAIDYLESRVEDGNATVSKMGVKDSR